MPIPSATWQTKPVHVTYRNIATGLLEAGTWTASTQQTLSTLSSSSTTGRSGSRSDGARYD